MTRRLRSDRLAICFAIRLSFSESIYSGRGGPRSSSGYDNERLPLPVIWSCACSGKRSKKEDFEFLEVLGAGLLDPMALGLEYHREYTTARFPGFRCRDWVSAVQIDVISGADFAVVGWDL